jgi:hypothetical protein
MTDEGARSCMQLATRCPKITPSVILFFFGSKTPSQKSK